MNGQLCQSASFQHQQPGCFIYPVLGVRSNLADHFLQSSNIPDSILFVEHTLQAKLRKYHRCLYLKLQQLQQHHPKLFTCSTWHSNAKTAAPAPPWARLPPSPVLASHPGGRGSLKRPQIKLQNGTATCRVPSSDLVTSYYIIYIQYNTNMSMCYNSRQKGSHPYLQCRNCNKKKKNTHM